MNSHNTDFPFDETNDLIEQRTRTLKWEEKRKNLNETFFTSTLYDGSRDAANTIRPKVIVISKGPHVISKGPHVDRRISGSESVHDKWMNGFQRRRDLSLCRNKIQRGKARDFAVDL